VCAGCATRTSITAGTVFDKTRVPLPGWFLLAWRMTSDKTAGISAKGAQRLLELGSYQTAWTMQHKLRSAMVRPGRDRLQGDVEVDETFVGGTKPGPPGRGAHGKVLVCIAVEVLSPMGFGRARLSVIPDASAKSIHRFVKGAVEPGAVVMTDGWPGYRGLDAAGYTHKPTSISGTGAHAHVTMPAVHRVAALFKRSLLNAYQSYPQLHLQAYCDEWAFRFNRRSSTHRGQLFLRLLENAVECNPLEYTAITLSSKPRTVAPVPSGRHGVVRTPSVNDAMRPWRP
jgi:transposase-like protein